MTEWTQDKPTEQGFYWTWSEGSERAALARVYDATGSNELYIETGGAETLSVFVVAVDYWLRADIETPAPPPAAQPVEESEALKDAEAQRDELLEALKLATVCLGQIRDKPEWWWIYLKAKAAIAKATGEESG